MGNNTIGTAKDNGCPASKTTSSAAARAVLGLIRIGKALTGANAVVLSDVPGGRDRDRHSREDSLPEGHRERCRLT